MTARGTSYSPSTTIILHFPVGPDVSWNTLQHEVGANEVQSWVYCQSLCEGFSSSLVCVCFRLALLPGVCLPSENRPILVYFFYSVHSGQWKEDSNLTSLTLIILHITEDPAWHLLVNPCPVKYGFLVESIHLSGIDRNYTFFSKALCSAAGLRRMLLCLICLAFKVCISSGTHLCLICLNDDQLR